MTTTYWYLATPYSKYPGGIDAAFDMACTQAALLARAGIPVFSPIAHSHPIAKIGEIDPHDHAAIWLPFDKPMMDAASGLIMVRAPSWQESYGMECEYAEFSLASKPVVWMDPGKVPEVLFACQ